jgi:hypothetical protein
MLFTLCRAYQTRPEKTEQTRQPQFDGSPEPLDKHSRGLPRPFRPVWNRTYSTKIPRTVSPYGNLSLHRISSLYIIYQLLPDCNSFFPFVPILCVEFFSCFSIFSVHLSQNPEKTPILGEKKPLKLSFFGLQRASVVV